MYSSDIITNLRVKKLSVDKGCFRPNFVYSWHSLLKATPTATAAEQGAAGKATPTQMQRANKDKDEKVH